MVMNHGLKTRKTVLSSKGRCLGDRCVMYDRARKVYVHFSGVGETPTRAWAWSGTKRQASNARGVFGIPAEFEVYLDGEEKGVV